MNESYALHTADEADRYALQTAQALGDIVADLPKSGADATTLYATQAITDLLTGVSRSALVLAQMELDEAARKSGRRSFAGGNFELELSDFYSNYLPTLVDNWSTREREQLMRTLQRGAERRQTTSQTAQEVAKEYHVTYGRGNTIVRTEATRAASMARRFVAARAIAAGRGPDFFVYKSLLDGDTTRTCQVRHNIRWTPAEDRVELWPPAHFSCRAGVVFAWTDEDTLQQTVPLSSAILQGWQMVQRDEFPTWQSNLIVAQAFTPSGAAYHPTQGTGPDHGPKRGAIPEIQPGALGKMGAIRAQLKAAKRAEELAAESDVLKDARLRKEAIERAQKNIIRERTKRRMN